MKGIKTRKRTPTINDESVRIIVEVIMTGPFPSRGIYRIMVESNPNRENNMMSPSEDMNAVAIPTSSMENKWVAKIQKINPNPISENLLRVMKIDC